MAPKRTRSSKKDSPADKRQRYSALVYPKGVAEDPRLSDEAKAHYIGLLTPLWAVKNANSSGSIAHADATANIIAVTKDFMRDARESAAKQEQGHSLTQASLSPLAGVMVSSSSSVVNPVNAGPNIAANQSQLTSATLGPAQPTSQPTEQTTPETALMTAMREHTAALNNHAAALDRHTAALEKQMRDSGHD